MTVPTELPKLECREHDGRAYRCAHRGASFVVDEGLSDANRRVLYAHPEHGGLVGVVVTATTVEQADHAFAGFVAMLVRGERPPASWWPDYLDSCRWLGPSPSIGGSVVDPR